MRPVPSGASRSFGQISSRFQLRFAPADRVGFLRWVANRTGRMGCGQSERVEQSPNQDAKLLSRRFHAFKPMNIKGCFDIKNDRYFFDFQGKSGAPSTIRTCGLCLRRATLYPAELWVHWVLILSSIAYAMLTRKTGAKSSDLCCAQGLVYLCLFYLLLRHRPLTSTFGGQRSIQLSYGCLIGGDSASAAWVQSQSGDDERNAQSGIPGLNPRNCYRNR